MGMYSELIVHNLEKFKFLIQFIKYSQTAVDGT